MSWGLFCARSSAFYQMHINVWFSDSYRQKTGDIQPSCGLGCQTRVGPPAFVCTVPHGCFWIVASGRQTSWMSLVLPRRHASTIHVWLSPKAGWPARMMTLRSCMASACNIVPSAPAAEWIGGNKSHSPNPCWFIWCTVSKTSLGRTAFCRLPGSVKRARCGRLHWVAEEADVAIYCIMICLFMYDLTFKHPAWGPVVWVYVGDWAGGIRHNKGTSWFEASVKKRCPLQIYAKHNLDMCLSVCLLFLLEAQVNDLYCTSKHVFLEGHR